jgi:hypothetical protein
MREVMRWKKREMNKKISAGLQPDQNNNRNIRKAERRNPARVDEHGDQLRSGFYHSLTNDLKLIVNNQQRTELSLLVSPRPWRKITTVVGEIRVSC